MSVSKAPLEYWESVWRSAPTGQSVSLAPGYSNYVARRFAEVLRRSFLAAEPAARRVMEVGCGNSGWLAAMHTGFGVAADGLDYSPTGHDRAAALLRDAGGPGRVYLADMFVPPSELLNAYDVAFSFGVVEHFEDTASAVRAIGRLVRPGGMVVTFVPNFAAMMGVLQRMMNRQVYERHVPLDADRLAAAHERAGLIVEERGYTPLLNLDVVNHGRRGLAGRVLQVGFAIGNRAGYLIDEAVRPAPRRLVAPYAYVAARVVASAEQRRPLGRSS